MDVTSVFLQSISRKDCDPIPRKSQRDLVRAAQQGDLPARNQLVQSMLRYVVKWAKLYSLKGLPMLDLVQVGALGVMRAIEKFDLDHGASFTTYATFWIRQTMQRANLRRDVIRIEFSPESPDEDLKHTNRLSDVQLANVPDQSVTGSPAERSESKDFSAYVQAAIDTLPTRQQTIVRRRMDGDSQSAIGDSMGITKERVRQLEHDAYRALKRVLDSKPRLKKVFADLPALLKSV